MFLMAYGSFCSARVKMETTFIGIYGTSSGERAKILHNKFAGSVRDDRFPPRRLFPRSLEFSVQFDEIRFSWHRKGSSADFSTRIHNLSDSTYEYTV